MLTAAQNTRHLLNDLYRFLFGKAATLSPSCYLLDRTLGNLAAKGKPICTAAPLSRPLSLTAGRGLWQLRPVNACHTDVANE
jgi:hypothetical protein